jgi:hypothetical protein
MAPLVGSISPPPPALWLAPIFILFHGPQAHVNSCGNRPVRRAIRLRPHNAPGGLRRDVPPKPVGAKADFTPLCAASARCHAHAARSGCWRLHPTSNAAEVRGSWNRSTPSLDPAVAHVPMN